MKNYNYVTDFEYKKFYKRKSFEYFKPLISLFYKNDLDQTQFSVFTQDILSRVGDRKKSEYFNKLNNTSNHLEEVINLTVLDHNARKKLIQQMR